MFDRYIKRLCLKLVLPAILYPLLFLLLYWVYTNEPIPKSTNPYYDSSFGQVMSKQPTMKELKAMRARQEPLVKNPTQEEIDMLLADIDRYRKRYEANNINKSTVIRAFDHNYRYYSKYREVIKDLITKLADEGDFFALSTKSIRGDYYELQRYKTVAVERGEPISTVWEGWFIGTGFLRERNAARGEELLRAAVDMGNYEGYKTLISYYYRYREEKKLCDIARQAYDKFGLEIFSFEIINGKEEIGYLQKRCRLFNDKYYTSEEMKFDYLKDIKTDQSKMVQAMLLSLERFGRYGEAREIFEELAENADQKIMAISQYCLSRMYYYGYGVKRNEEIADNYAEKSFSNGNSYSTIYKLLYANQPYLYQLPEQLILTDYDGVCGYCFDKK